MAKMKKFLEGQKKQRKKAKTTEDVGTPVGTPFGNPADDIGEEEVDVFNKVRALTHQRPSSSLSYLNPPEQKRQDVEVMSASTLNS